MAFIDPLEPNAKQEKQFVDPLEQSVSQPELTFRQRLGGRISEAGEYLESKRKKWTSPTEQKGKTPEWAGKSPTAYGALGSLRESAIPIAEGVALGSNMTPLGIATGGLKYAAVDQVASMLDKFLGNKEETTLGEQAKQSLWKTGEGVVAKGVLGSVVPAAQGVRSGLQGTAPKTVTGTAINTAKESFKEADILATGVEGVNKTIKQIVKAFMPKAIGTSPKNTMRGMDKYADDVTPAVEDIVAHKNAIDQTGNRVFDFVDKKGQPLKNNIPNSADNQLQAIKTRKPQIWKETLGEIQEASQGGAVVPVQPMVGKLESLLTKEKESLIPDTATRNHIVGIIDRMKQYEKTGVPLQQAQQELTQLNAKIFGTAKIEYDSFGKKEVDQYIASYLRNTLDDTIKNFTGTPRYENLKNLYGSYRTLEDDTIKAVARSAKKQDFSMFDISDIWIGYHTGVSALTGNVPGLIAAGGSEMAKKYMATRMKPDSQLKTMYDRVDKLMEQKSKFENPRTEFGQAVKKGMTEGGGYQSRAEAYHKNPGELIDWAEQTEGLSPSAAARKAAILEMRAGKRLPAVVNKKPVPTGEPSTQHPNWEAVSPEEARRLYPRLTEPQKKLPEPQKKLPAPVYEQRAPGETYGRRETPTVHKDSEVARTTNEKKIELEKVAKEEKDLKKRLKELRKKKGELSD